MILILQRTDGGDWQIVSTAADTSEADSITAGRMGDFILLDPDALAVTGFRRVLTREPIAPTTSTALSQA